MTRIPCKDKQKIKPRGKKIGAPSSYNMILASMSKTGLIRTAKNLKDNLSFSVDGTHMMAKTCFI